MEFGKRLRETRILRKKTQQEMADLIGVALQSYQRYEQGEREPSLSMLITLADVLEVSADDLLGRSGRSDEKS